MNLLNLSKYTKNIELSLLHKLSKFTQEEMHPQQLLISEYNFWVKTY